MRPGTTAPVCSSAPASTATPTLYDIPAHGNTGTRYLVERGLTTNAELQALIADYLATAKRLGYPPMHGWL